MMTVYPDENSSTLARARSCLLGQLAGDAIPVHWLDSLQTYCPEVGNPRVRHPHPECFWPVDLLELAEGLAAVTRANNG